MPDCGQQSPVAFLQSLMLAMQRLLWAALDQAAGQPVQRLASIVERALS